MYSEDKITAPRVYKMFNISKEKFRDLMDRGYITPTIKAPSKGKPAFFTRKEVCYIALLLHLTDNLRFPREVAHKLVSRLREYSLKAETVKDIKTTAKVEKPLSNEVWFFIYGDSITIYEVYFSRDILPELSKVKASHPGADLLIIDMKRLRDFVDAGFENVA